MHTTETKLAVLPIAFAEAELPLPKDPFRVDLTKTDFELFRDHMFDLGTDMFEDVPRLHLGAG